MARRKTLSDVGVSNLKPRATRYVVADPELPGHYIRVMPSGLMSYVAVTRDPGGKQVWATVGSTSLVGIDEAREKAREAIKAIKAGENRARPDTFKATAENWLKRHVEAKGLRTKIEIERCLAKYIYPAWEGREFTSIRRSDVAVLLDEIEDRHGPRQADAVLTIVRSITNWFATRHDDYVSPVVRGMRRVDPMSSKRARILDDDEVRAVWRQAEANGTFGAIVRLALLTAQRREKIAAMRWEDVTTDGEWRIPAEDREKGTGGSLVLPAMAIDIIRAQPHFGSNPFVFAGRGDGHFNGFSPCKKAFDKKMKIAPWVIHDLRRSARSLMSRAGVRPDIAERVMGHAIPGVEGIYDRHSYRDEKADALRRLAALIETILHPPVGNVVPLVAAK
jgi:integrase